MLGIHRPVFYREPDISLEHTRTFLVNYFFNRLNVLFSVKRSVVILDYQYLFLKLKKTISIPCIFLRYGSQTIQRV